MKRASASIEAWVDAAAAAPPPASPARAPEEERAPARTRLPAPHVCLCSSRRHDGVPIALATGASVKLQSQPAVRPRRPACRAWEGRALFLRFSLCAVPVFAFGILWRGQPPETETRLPWRRCARAATDRVTDMSGAVGLKDPRQIQMIMNAEVKPLNCCGRCQACLFCCSTFDLERSYLYVRENSIESNFAISPVLRHVRHRVGPHRGDLLRPPALRRLLRRRLLRELLRRPPGGPLSSFRAACAAA